MITPSFAISATERVLPSMALDFTIASLDSRVTFTRAGNTATCVNSSGNIALVNADLPRFDFNPTTLICNGLLIEESRVNSIRNNTMVGAVAGTPGTLPTNYFGEQYSNISRQIIGTGTENGISYIDIRYFGTANATTISYIDFDLTIAATVSQTWTNSVYLKLQAGSFSGLSSAVIGIEEHNAATIFLAGSTTSITGITNASLITQRISLTRTLTSATTALVYPTLVLKPINGSTVDITLRIGLPQLEQGAFPTSVIPTSVAQVTRTADTALMTGTNFSSWYNQTQGTFQAEFIKYVSNADGRIWWIDDGSINNAITMSASASGKMYLEGLSGGVYGGNVQNGTLVANSTMRACVAYSNTTTEAVSLAAATTTTGSLTLPSSGLTRAAIGYQASIVGTYFNGWIRKMSYYPQRLTDNEVQAFSK